MVYFKWISVVGLFALATACSESSANDATGGSSGTGGHSGESATGGSDAGGAGNGGGGTTAGGNGGGGTTAGGNGGGGQSSVQGCDLGAAAQAITDLGIVVQGSPDTLNETLPAALTDANWGVKSQACQDGGYDISALASTTVCLVGQDMTQLCDGDAARVWVVMRDGAVECVYKAVGPASSITPGVYSVNSTSCQ